MRVYSKWIAIAREIRMSDNDFKKNDMDAIVGDPDKPIKWKTPEGPKPVKVESIASAIKRKRQVVFLDVFRQCGVAKTAQDAAKINYQTRYNWIKNDPWFREQYKNALAEYREVIEMEIHDRAINGVKVPIIGKKQVEIGQDSDGNPIFAAEDQQLTDADGNPLFKIQKSDLLLMFHAKKHIPEYRDDYEEPDEKPKGTESPMARITVRLEMIANRQQHGLPAMQGSMALPEHDEADDDAIEIIPEESGKQE